MHTLLLLSNRVYGGDTAPDEQVLAGIIVGVDDIPDPYPAIESDTDVHFAYFGH